MGTISNPRLRSSRRRSANRGCPDRGREGRHHRHVLVIQRAGRTTRKRIRRSIGAERVHQRHLAAHRVGGEVDHHVE
ncbi:MAG: hypothetical protein LC799_28750, partial [Actinobacteria bacterium]|nr:hypothetical protein [Actinomycetota bacterium]